MARLVVIGAGAMGLAAAYRAARNGHQVDLIEAAPEPGGMAGHFDFGGISLERFYHFVCKTDYPTFDLLQELGLADCMRWVPTTMGFYSQGKLYPWGSPPALLKIPMIGWLDKLRYALFVFVCVRRNSWPALEHQSAKAWIIRWCGRNAYERLWRSLFDYKFYEYAETISAAWIWTRIRRIGRSRKSILQEELGYMEGGSITLVNALMDGIRQHGGRIHLSEPAAEVTTQDGRVTGVRTANGFFPADAVIGTAPTPFIATLVPDLPADWKARYEAIQNIGVICVIFKLARSVTSNFWVNIEDEGTEIPGVIEFSNLRPFGGQTIIYVPYYMPVTHPKFSWSDRQLLDEAFTCLRKLNPALTATDILDTKVARLRNGQPICDVGFASRIPPVQTPIAGLQMADTCFYYPEDRGIAESVRLGQAMAMNLPGLSA